MKAVCLLMTVVSAGWCQTPGTRGHSANARGPATGPGYLGVGVVQVTEERAKALKLSAAAGVEVKRIDDDSPAAKAGLKTDDVILDLNGQKIESVMQFITIIGVTAPGTKISLTVWREGSKQNLNATLEARRFTIFQAEPNELPALPSPPFEIMPEPSPLVGIDGETLTTQLAQFFGVKEGVLVRSVLARSPAEKAGFKAGDVVVKVNGTPVDSIREISGVIRAGHKAFAFTVVRNHKEMTLNVELALEFDPWHATPLAFSVGSSSDFSLLP
jgi:serine protease Do